MDHQNIPDNGSFRFVQTIKPNLGLSAPAVAIMGYPFALGAAREVCRRRLSMDALIAAGSLAAFFVSAASTIRGRGHIYYDTATMLLVLVTFGRLIEAA
jgi:cation transport ATPase